MARIVVYVGMLLGGLLTVIVLGCFLTNQRPQPLNRRGPRRIIRRGPSGGDLALLHRSGP